jgi:hypothetical protein
MEKEVKLCPDKRCFQAMGVGREDGPEMAWANTAVK